MENWKAKLFTEIQEKLKDNNEKDIRFFRIDEFKRNVERTGEFSGKCPVCSSNKMNIEQIIGKIDEAISVPGSSRRQYDKFINSLSKHMRKEHLFFPPFFNTYLYSFIGATLGLIIGYFGHKFYPTSEYIVLIAIFSIGLLIGNFIGNKKDRKIRNENRLM